MDGTAHVGKKGERGTASATTTIRGALRILQTEIAHPGSTKDVVVTVDTLVRGLGRNVRMQRGAPLHVTCHWS